MIQNLTKLQNKFSKQPSLIAKYNLDVKAMPIVSDVDFSLSYELKTIIVEKLLEAHNLASANVQAGNITGRGFATNVCTTKNIWSVGTNFNNTRNDISSICGERVAILNSYSKALMEFSNSDKKTPFDFKIKYLCMATSIDLKKRQKSIAPCEDCLSWLNTNRYFDENTTIFSFERDDDDVLKLYATNLSKILPFKKYKTSNKFSQNKTFKYTAAAIDSISENSIDKNALNNLFLACYDNYLNTDHCKITKQNISAAILTQDNVYVSSKIDWTRRWFVEPLENALASAIQKEGENICVKAIAYFGDEISKTSNGEFQDGLVSIKSLGRIRQKYAKNNTLIILNLENEVLITTLGEYLPKKFVQGYKIV